MAEVLPLWDEQPEGLVTRVELAEILGMSEASVRGLGPVPVGRVKRVKRDAFLYDLAATQALASARRATPRRMPVRRTWEARLATLQAWVDEHGHADIPRLERVGDFSLGDWIAGQRSLYHRGKLPEARAEALEAVPGWRWVADPSGVRRVAGDRWGFRYRMVQAWAAEHGHAQVPHDVTVDDYRLGYWVRRQRGAYMRGELSEAQIVMLEALHGWSWRPQAGRPTGAARTPTPTRALWSDHLAELIRWASENGRANPPATGSLGRWVAHQRLRYRAGTLPADRIAALEAVPGWRWGGRAHKTRMPGSVHFPAGLLAEVDRLAASAGTTRPRWIRQAVADRIAAEDAKEGPPPVR